MFLICYEVKRKAILKGTRNKLAEQDILLTELILKF